MLECMASITEEVADIEQQQGWAKLFFDIKRISSQYNFSCQVAKLQENRSKNRYRDVCPYDHSRVKLNAGSSDYINSCEVEVKDIGRRYILSQGPLPNTSGQFWQMVWEQNSKAVIMLNKIIEKGMIKCHHYWPVDSQHPLLFREEGYRVALKNERDMESYMIREIELTNTKTDESRIVYQFHFVAWPDFDVPQSPATFLDFLACVREYNVLENDPAVIHCSAGIGRSGTFALVDTCLKYLQMGMSFDIYKTLLEMRKCRMGLVQTPQQLRFSYFAIAECERILLYKQGDEDSYSEGAPSEDYDFMYDENNDDDDELLNNDLATADGKSSESETTVKDNRDTNESPYLGKDTTKLNNNISDPLKIEPPSSEIETKTTEPEPKRQKSDNNEAEVLAQEAKPAKSMQTSSNEIADDNKQFDSVSSENDKELVDSLPAAKVETENSAKPKQIDQYADAKHEEVNEREDEILTSTDKKQTSNLVPIVPSADEIESKHNQEEKPITPLLTSSRDGDGQSEEDNFSRVNGIEKTAVLSESPEKAFETIEKDNEERTWKVYLLGGLVLSLVFSLIYSVYE